MPELKFIHFEAKQVLLMDFAGISDMDLLSSLVDESIRLVHATNSRRSVLALMDLSSTRVNRTVIGSLKRLSQNNGPYIKAITFVGLGLPSSIIMSILLRVTKRNNHRVFSERNEALDWLTQQ